VPKALLTLVLVAVVSGAGASPALAITLQEVVTLSQGGAPDDVILAMIERDANVFTLDAEKLVALRNAGVSEAVVLAMIRSGRQQPPAPAPALPILPTPSVVIVGDGPDIPNTARTFEFVAPIVAPPAIVPYGAYFAPVGNQAACVPSVQAHAAHAGRGIFFSEPYNTRGMFFPHAETAAAASSVSSDCSPVVPAVTRARR
jgi:hypothetical protein